MEISEAIKKAIESGWDEARADIIHGPSNIVIASEHKAFLDPLFWSSLGKAMGWKSNCNEHKTAWEHQAMQFFSHLLTGGNAEEWFKRL